MDREEPQNCWKSWETVYNGKLVPVRDKDQKPEYACVYCEKPGNKSSECE